MPTVTSNGEVSAYRGIQVPPGADATVARLIRERINLYLGDVHAMLCLPLPAQGIEAGCNFAVAETLCAVISGLSRIAMRHEHSGAAFRKILACYPAADEPHALPPDYDFAETLYGLFRNGLVHSIGMNLKGSEGARPPWRIEALERPTKIRRNPGAERLPGRLDELETDDGPRPAWLDATLAVEGKTLYLSPAALYWGTRRLVRTVATTPHLVAGICELMATAPADYGLSPAGVPGPTTVQSTEIRATVTAIRADVPPFGDRPPPDKSKG